MWYQQLFSPFIILRFRAISYPLSVICKATNQGRPFILIQHSFVILCMSGITRLHYQLRCTSRSDPFICFFAAISLLLLSLLYFIESGNKRKDFHIFWCLKCTIVSLGSKDKTRLSRIFLNRYSVGHSPFQSNKNNKIASSLHYTISYYGRAGWSSFYFRVMTFLSGRNAHAISKLKLYHPDRNSL